jgi:hypothetical protein
MELWNKYFAPHVCNGGSVNSEKVFNIPSKWFNFITLMLLTPKKIEWAKSFLNSPLWEHVRLDDEDNNSIFFVVPDSCLVKKAHVCQIADLGPNDSAKKGIVDNGATPSAPKRKRRGTAPIVE